LEPLQVFFIWNYPNGHIFLGDGGAYLIGLYIAVLSILLIQRHPNVSPFYALVVNAYPIFETLFTIWRRKVHRGRKSMIPDGIHFHTLIYRRVLRWATRDERVASLNNAKTSPYLWALSSITIVPATLWWSNQTYLIITALLFCTFYIVCYKWIVRFKSIR
jgi:UDP-N-acetylmuramyl pentapeptide phosphotransferase/UDP-N-acetylglucosamine-1-phosphate transferase